MNVTATSLLAKNVNLKNYLREGMIRNFPLNPEDSVRANHIYGPFRLLLQGGMNRLGNLSKRAPRVTLPTDISLHHKYIELYLFFPCMNRIPFLHTKVYKITFLPAENYISNSADKIINELNTVNRLYKARGLNMDVLYGDKKFNLDYKHMCKLTTSSHY